MSNERRNKPDPLSEMLASLPAFVPVSTAARLTGESTPKPVVKELTEEVAQER